MNIMRDNCNGWSRFDRYDFVIKAISGTVELMVCGMVSWEKHS